MARRFFFIVSAAAFAQTANIHDLRLLLLIGQSNMAGRGPIDPEDRQPIPGVYKRGEDRRWTAPVDPLHFDKPRIAGAGIGRSFAKTLLAFHPSVSIGLIPAALGGTSLEQWSPAGKLYTEALSRARAAASSGGLRGILWHQGEAETDDADAARTYSTRFGAFIQQLRADLEQPEVPVVVGELGRFQHHP